MRSERGMVLLLSLVAVVILSGLGFSAVQQTRLTSVWVRNTMDVGLARLPAQRAIELNWPCFIRYLFRVLPRKVTLGYTGWKFLPRLPYGCEPQPGAQGAVGQLPRH